MIDTYIARKAATMNTMTDRQNLYYAKQKEILQTLDAIKNVLFQHGACAASEHYHWGFLGDLDHIQAHLDQLVNEEE